MPKISVWFKSILNDFIVLCIQITIILCIIVYVWIILVRISASDFWFAQRVNKL